MTFDLVPCDYNNKISLLITRQITFNFVNMAAPSRGPTYKVVLLGELGVGKTSLFRRLKDNTFDEYQTATTGIDSCTKVVKVDGETVMVGNS